jgi:hypothetical protein
MKTNPYNITQKGESGFDLFRLSKSKDVVDICSNTLRQYNKEGLPFYRKGKAVFISRDELLTFIRTPRAAKVGAK